VIEPNPNWSTVGLSVTTKTIGHGVPWLQQRDPQPQSRAHPNPSLQFPNLSVSTLTTSRSRTHLSAVVRLNLHVCPCRPQYMSCVDAASSFRDCYFGHCNRSVLLTVYFTCLWRHSSWWEPIMCYRANRNQAHLLRRNRRTALRTSRPRGTLALRQLISASWTKYCTAQEIVISVYSWELFVCAHERCRPFDGWID